jgi:hypothetical protein
MARKRRLPDPVPADAASAPRAGYRRLMASDGLPRSDDERWAADRIPDLAHTTLRSGREGTSIGRQR